MYMHVLSGSHFAPRFAWLCWLGTHARAHIRTAICLARRGKLVKKLTKLEGEQKISKAAQKQLDKWMALAKKSAK
jgi:hypothetical protein